MKKEKIILIIAMFLIVIAILSVFNKYIENTIKKANESVHIQMTSDLGEILLNFRKDIDRLDANIEKSEQRINELEYQIGDMNSRIYDDRKDEEHPPRKFIEKSD
ncbi:MAG: hypothetical protein DRN27_05325 [Thermoplasmata archaeon]|nr:MAG: hypothetical protein DRN27_05325 [Thermoplasmata archaeon]